MLLGVVITVFYVEADLSGASVLVIPGILLIIAGIWLERHEAGRRSPWIDRGLELSASGTAVILLLSMSGVDIHYATPSKAVFYILTCLTPFAIAVIGRSRPLLPALPAVLAFVQLALLAAVAFTLAGGSDESGNVGVFLLLSMPLIGALIAALAYLLPMPWRPQAAVQLGLPENLCLGLIVSWAAIQIGKGPQVHAELTTVLSWALAVPVVEMFRRLFAGEMNLGTEEHAEAISGLSAGDGLGDARHVIPNSPAYAPIAGGLLVAASGCAGWFLWQMGVDAKWSLLMLMLAGVAYGTVLVRKRTGAKAICSRSFDPLG